MAIKVINTRDGAKLQDSKSGKLAGSRPKKPTVPVASRTSKASGASAPLNPNIDNNLSVKSNSKSAPHFSQDYITYFTEEYCEQLALELHRQRGWPLLACAENWIRDEEYGHDEDCYGAGINHILVGLPNGKFLDINGIQTQKQIAKNWPNTFIRPARECCFNTWVHPKKVSQVRIYKATQVLLQLV